MNLNCDVTMDTPVGTLLAYVAYTRVFPSFEKLTTTLGETYPEPGSLFSTAVIVDGPREFASPDRPTDSNCLGIKVVTQRYVGWVYASAFIVVDDA